ncbi:MAG TPA: hypothetical protein PLL88_01010 [Anaerolineaceae bacterium]|nr:hypothetical protein [Anaerolineaceae bacterium]
MSIKDQVTPEQWKALYNAISAASTYVSTASGGGLEMFQEAFSASKFMMESSQKAGGSGYGSLVDEILAVMKGMNLNDAKADAHQYQSKDIAALRAEAKQLVVDGAAAAAALPDGDGYKRWLVEMARKVAETKTGGILGFGGQAVIDEKEEAAIAELTELLGI